MIELKKEFKRQDYESRKVARIGTAYNRYIEIKMDREKDNQAKEQMQRIRTVDKQREMTKKFQVAEIIRQDKQNIQQAKFFN